MVADSASKNRLLVVAAVLICACIVALGVGLGLGLRKMDQGKDCVIVEEQPTTTTPSPTEESPLYFPPSPSDEGHYRFAGVACDSDFCSKVATEAMAKKGGSAVDAAIITATCLGLYNFQSSGIGGGHFLTYYNRENKTAYAIIGREMAPSAATENMYQNVSSQTGGLAIGIPGEIRGFYEAWKLGGKLKWSELFEPSIKMAREGFPAGQFLVDAIEENKNFFPNFTNLRDMVTNPETGEFYKTGEMIRLPKLADTLEIIANEGADAFYNGKLTKNISLDIQEAGGIITEDDLRSYEAKVKDAVLLTLSDGTKVFSPPAPSGGIVFQFMLNILDGYNFTEDSVSTVDKAVLTWHRITESFKHAFSLRSQLGDPDQGPQNLTDLVQELTQNMTNLAYGAEKRKKINDSRTYDTEYYEPAFTVQTGQGTAHASVIAANGDAVGITSTINTKFASKVVGSRTGLVFNNQMDDFSVPNTVNFWGVPASPSNFIKPGKRPLSSTSPCITVNKDGDVVLVTGGAGGPRITTASALIAIETLWFKWGIKESVDYPRLHHQLLPPQTRVEETFPQVLIDGLKAKGHDVSFLVAGSENVVGVQNSTIKTNNDYRRFGGSDGY